MFDYLLEWEGFKEALTAWLQIDRELLHVHLGLAVYLLVGTLMRNPLGSPVALLAVVVVELVNEGADYARYMASDWPWTPESTAADIINTLFWPTIIYFCAPRKAPRRQPEPVEAE